MKKMQTYTAHDEKCDSCTDNNIIKINLKTEITLKLGLYQSPTLAGIRHFSKSSRNPALGKFHQSQYATCFCQIWKNAQK